MFFSRRSGRVALAFKPEICVLEDRVTPSSYRFFGPAAPPPTAVTHLLVIAPANVSEGQATNVIVEALNSRNQVVPSFRGSVQMSLGSADANATLPAAFTFSAADKGKHTVQVTFGTPGPQSVIATDGGLSARAAVTVHSVVTHFAVYATGQATAGYPTSIEVVALDANNRIATDYRGTVHLSNSDVFAPQLANYTFQAADDGVHTFTISFATVGNQAVTATDVTNRAIGGSVSINVMSPWTYPIYSGWGYYGGWW